MDVQATEIPDVKIITPKKMGDHRGFFSETYSRKRFTEAQIDIEFVQDNHSLSAKKGTVRGLHFQIAPFAQHKLVRVVRGSVFDIAVDLRQSSPTFKRYVIAVLSESAWNQIFIPIGFAHGLCTLEPDTEVIYKVSELYSPEHERGLLWNDPDLAIPWPVTQQQAIVSDKDLKNPRLREFTELFI
jgi:dTDP-4-dehydrorhamnose 3,5-epimerase